MYLSPFALVALVVFVQLWILAERFATLDALRDERNGRCPPQPSVPAPPLPRIGYTSYEDYVAYRQAHGLPYTKVESMWSDGS